MIKQLVVHIGDHKTGSTSIQTALAHSGLQTEPQTIVYPSERSHNGLAKWISKDLRADELRKKLAKLRQIFIRSNADFGILSAEAFEGCAPSRLNEILRKHFPEFAANARIIAYVRPHAQRVLSSFAEQTKNGGFREDLRAFHESSLKKQRFIYAPRFEAWKETFGDRFVVKPMIRSLLEDGDVTKDFLREVLGPDCKITLPPNSGANSSLSLQDLVIMRLFHMNVPLEADTVKQPLAWQLQTILSKLPGNETTKTKVAMDGSLAEKVFADYVEDASRTDAAFFDGTPLSDSLKKDVTKTIETSQSLEAEDHFPPEMVARLNALIPAIAKMTTYQPHQMHTHLRGKTTDAFLANDPKRKPKTRKLREAVKSDSEVILDIIDRL